MCSSINESIVFKNWCVCALVFMNLLYLRIGGFVCSSIYESIVFKNGCVCVECKPSLNIQIYSKIEMHEIGAKLSG